MHLPSSHQFVTEIPTDLVYNYAPALGQMGLRQRWKEKLGAENPSLKGKPFSLPIVTCGMTHGFSLIGDLFVDKGDTLVLPHKMWGNYRLIFQTKYGATIQTYPFYNTAMQFNIEGFADTLKSLARTTEKLIVLLNFPHNPTGYALTAAESEQITEAILDAATYGCHVLALVDDAYFGLWYEEGVLHESVFGALVGLHPNVVAVKIDGATKEEYAWGMRVGFLTFGLDKEVMTGLEGKLTGLIRTNTSGTSQVSQTLVLQAMDSPTYAAEKQQKYVTLKARAMKAKMTASDPGYAALWDVYPFHAGYFMCLRLKNANAETVRQRLLNEHGIGVISLGETEIRVAFSCIEEEAIEAVFRALAEVVRDVENVHNSY